MKRPLPTALAVAALLLAVASASFAQSNPPIVANRIPDVSVAADTKTSTVKFKNTFALQGVGGPVVRFDTVEGNIDVELLPDDAPANVSNFLNYVNRGAYVDSFFHRSVPGFVIQGGGYVYTDDGMISTIPKDPPVVNEFKLPNTRGTLAMAKMSDPDSATSEWFFNLSNNTTLDSPTNSGGFTVFGRVISNGLTVVDAIAALPVNTANASPFGELPVHDYTSGPIRQSNVVLVNSIAPLPLVAAHAGLPAQLKLKVKSNTNPSLIKKTVMDGKKLTLTFFKGVTGSATLSIMAKDSSGNKATTSFTVTVE